MNWRLPIVSFLFFTWEETRQNRILESPNLKEGRGGGGVLLTTKPSLWTPLNCHLSNSSIFLPSVFYLTFLRRVRFTTTFGKSRDQNRKCLKTHRVNYVFHKFITQQSENILTQNLQHGFENKLFIQIYMTS